MPRIGEIKIVAFNFAPKGYMLCNGQRLSKSEYHHLYSILGDTYNNGDNDPLTFALPDLREHFVVHPGNTIAVGEKKGTDSVVLSTDQMPEHKHNVKVQGDATDSKDVLLPKNAYLNRNAGVFSTEASPNEVLGGVTQENIGNAAPLDIKNPSVEMYYVIYVGADDPSESFFVGEIKLWPGMKNYPSSFQRHWLPCNGESLRINEYAALHHRIGYFYGGSSANFNLPNLADRFPVGSDLDKVGTNGGSTTIKLTHQQLPPHNHNVQIAVNNTTDSEKTPTPNNGIINNNAGEFSEEIISSAALGGVIEESIGGNSEVDITNQITGMEYYICVSGILEPNAENSFIGEIKLDAGFKLSEGGLTNCFGQQYSINQYQSLFSLLGTMYGGDGRTYFLLPNLKGKSPIHAAEKANVGKASGHSKIKLKPENLPEHNHNVHIGINHGSDGRRIEIENGILNANAGYYSVNSTVDSFLSGLIQDEFLGEDVDIRNPFLTIGYLICLDGDFPSRS